MLEDEVVVLHLRHIDLQRRVDWARLNDAALDVGVRVRDGGVVETVADIGTLRGGDELRDDVDVRPRAAVDAVGVPVVADVAAPGREAAAVLRHIDDAHASHGLARLHPGVRVERAGVPSADWWRRTATTTLASSHSGHVVVDEAPDVAILPSCLRRSRQRGWRWGRRGRGRHAEA